MTRQEYEACGKAFADGFSDGLERAKKMIEQANKTSEKKMYLIYTDSADDCCDIKGYIYGTEEDADKYCDEYNTKCEYYWREVTWIEISNLLE